MKLEGSIALVTGANRGLGVAYTRALLERGAAKIYAAARRPETIIDSRVVPLRVDVTDRSSIVEATQLASDVTLLINNAGISTGARILSDEAGLREELEVNYLGPIAVARSFAPVLAANGGAIVNVLSVLSWVSFPSAGGYCASKSALWSATNSLRLSLAGQHTQVVAVHVGYMDTDMTAAVTAAKIAPEAVADATLDALQAGEHEVLADEVSRQVRAQLSGPLGSMYPSLDPQPVA